MLTHHKTNKKTEAWERGDNDNNTKKRYKRVANSFASTIVTWIANCIMA
jgi:hypothetical protein